MPNRFKGRERASYVLITPNKDTFNVPRVIVYELNVKIGSFIHLTVEEI